MFNRNKSRDLFEHGRQLLDSQDYDGAIQYFSRALQAAKNDFEKIAPLHFRGIAYIEKTEKMTTNGESDEQKINGAIMNNMQLAVEDFSQAITNTKVNASDRSDIISDLYVCLARAHSWLGSSEDVITDSNNALKFNSQNAEAFRARGWVYSEVLSNPSAAIDDFTNAIKIQHSATDYIYRAWAYLDLDKELEARDDYLQAVRLDPEVRNSQRTSSIYNNRMWENFKNKYDHLGAG